MSNVQIQMVVKAKATDDAGAILRDWFDTGLTAFSAPLAGWLSETSTDNHPNHTHVIERYEKASLYASRPNSPGTAHRPVTAESWRFLMSELDRAPVWAEVSLPFIGAEVESWNPHPLLRIGSHVVSQEGPHWILLFVETSVQYFCDTPDGQAWLIRFLQDRAARTKPTHGEISYIVSGVDSALGQGLFVDTDQAITNSGEFLRGYAWVTIVGEDLCRRLGGPDALRKSGAFVEVETLAAGSVWLKATDDWRDFDAAAAERVFAILAGVLPDGRPNRIDRNVLVRRDPRDLTERAPM